MIEQIKQALENENLVHGVASIPDIKKDEWLRYLIGEVERMEKVVNNVDMEAYTRLEGQVEELQKTIGALNDFVFANHAIPKSARSHMQRIIHYDLPKSLQALKGEDNAT